MPRECLGTGDRCCRIRIGRGPSDTGPRFGGRAPAGVAPQNHSLKYLLTVPWGKGLELSVFVDADPDYIYDDAVLLPCGTPHFEVKLHRECGRGSRSPSDSAMTEHPLLIDAEMDDLGPIDDDGIQRPYSGHKLGGRPYFVHGDLRLEESVAALRSQGFLHAVQMDFPADPDAKVAGPWPFGNGMFHVLVREVGTEVEAQCFWEL